MFPGHGLIRKVQPGQPKDRKKLAWDSSMDWPQPNSCVQYPATASSGHHLVRHRHFPVPQSLTASHGRAEQAKYLADSCQPIGSEGVGLPE